MHLTPVDYVSKAIVQLASQPTSWGKAFHLNNPQPLSMLELVEYIKSRQYQLKSTDYDGWLNQLLALDPTRNNALKPLLPLLTNTSTPSCQLNHQANRY